MKKQHHPKGKAKISILVSDLSSVGSGRWGLDSGDRPFMLSKALKYIGHEVEIIGLGDSDLEYSSNGRSICVVSKQEGRKVWGSFHKVISSIKGQIVYAYKPKLSSFGLALLSGITKRRKVFLDIDDWELSWHGGDDFQYKPSIKQLSRDFLKTNGSLRNPEHPAYTKLVENLIPMAEKITTHNNFLRERFGGTLIPNGKDMELFNPSLYNSEESRQELGLSGFKILMFPGAPRPYKGVEDILNALEKLRDPLLKLVIVGGSPYDNYDGFLHQKWGHRLIQLAAVPYSDMPKYISAAHVVVVPQRDTPITRAQFPLKITDGMAMAKPILATKVGDISEILGNTGYLVEPGQPEALAIAIQEIFRNYEAAKKVGLTARKRCSENYSYESMATELKNVFNLND